MTIIGSYLRDESGMYNGIAPDATLVPVKAFDEQGRGSYADVIRAIDWVVQNKDAYNIRILNMSFSAPPQSYYWEDPINQAVMQAWQAGKPGAVDALVVFGVAGNHAQEIIELAAHQVALQDLRHPRHGLFKFLESLLGLRRERESRSRVVDACGGELGLGGRGGRAQPAPQIDLPADVERDAEAV